jgi:hypothetical protein
MPVRDRQMRLDDLNAGMAARETFEPVGERHGVVRIEPVGQPHHLQGGAIELGSQPFEQGQPIRLQRSGSDCGGFVASLGCGPELEFGRLGTGAQSRPAQQEHAIDQQHR